MKPTAAALVTGRPTDTVAQQPGPRRVARVLLASTARGDGEPLAEHVRAFAGNARALQQLLDNLSLLVTYDADLRHALPTVWPALTQVVLDAIAHWLPIARGYLARSMPSSA